MNNLGPETDIQTEENREKSSETASIPRKQRRTRLCRQDIRSLRNMQYRPFSSDTKDAGLARSLWLVR